MLAGCFLLFFGAVIRESRHGFLLLLTLYMAVHSFAELYQSRFFRKTGWIYAENPYFTERFSRFASLRACR